MEDRDSGEPGGEGITGNHSQYSAGGSVAGAVRLDGVEHSGLVVVQPCTGEEAGRVAASSGVWWPGCGVLSDMETTRSRTRLGWVQGEVGQGVRQGAVDAPQ